MMSRLVQDHEITFFTLLFSYLLMDLLVILLLLEKKEEKEKNGCEMVVKTPPMMTFKGWWCDWSVVVACGKWGSIWANILWNYFGNDFNCWALCACVFTLDDCCDVNWLNLDCWPSELVHDFGRRPIEIFKPIMTIHSTWSWTSFHECSPLCIDFSRTWPNPLRDHG